MHGNGTGWSVSDAGCSLRDSAPGPHCLDSTHGPVSADGASALRRLSEVRVAARLHHARAG
jgi:hypothetical protein